MACMQRRRAPQARLPPRRQSDGGIVGFTPASRQRPLPSRSTRPRLANRPRRMETALLSQRVACAHWTTPASGSSRIASSSACSLADASCTPGLEPRARLERERDDLPRPAPLGLAASVCSHWAIWPRTESGQVRIVSIASRSAPSSARSTACLPLQDARSSNRTRPPARKVCGSRTGGNDGQRPIRKSSCSVTADSIARGLRQRSKRARRCVQASVTAQRHIAPLSLAFRSRHRSAASAR